MSTTGGDHGRQAELTRIKAEMTTAMTRGDMTLVTMLAGKYAELDAKPSEPVRTIPKKTGRTLDQAWEEGTLADRRTF